MILAVNVNAALDNVYLIDTFVPGAHMRAQKAVLSVGGKGLDTAVVLKTLGAPVRAISFIAGRNGQTLAELLAQKQIESTLIWLPGETRVSNVLVETSLNRHSHVTTEGYTVTAEDCERLLAKITELGPVLRWAVIAGSIPPGASTSLYREVIGVLKRFQINTLIDTTGEPMRQALLAFPEIVKMNQEELEATFNVKASTLPELLWVCPEQMQQHQIKSLVITLGKDGILAFTPAGILHAGCEHVPEVSAAGAGDAVSAALVYRLSLAESWPQALKWAAAVAAAVVLTVGTAECDMADVMDIYPHVWVKKIKEPYKI